MYIQRRKTLFSTTVYCQPQTVSNLEILSIAQSHQYYVATTDYCEV